MSVRTAFPKMNNSSSTRGRAKLHKCPANAYTPSPMIHPRFSYSPNRQLRGASVQRAAKNLGRAAAVNKQVATKHSVLLRSPLFPLGFSSRSPSSLAEKCRARRGRNISCECRARAHTKAARGKKMYLIHARTSNARISRGGTLFRARALLARAATLREESVCEGA